MNKNEAMIEPIILRLPIKGKGNGELYEYDPVVKELKSYNEIDEQSSYSFLEKKEGGSGENVKEQISTFIDANDLKRIPARTDISCWWCCHPFSTPPIPLPEKCVGEVFHVKGCFCSFNCALAYNLKLRDNKVRSRESMLRYMMKKAYPSISISGNFNPAPDNKILKKFGGILTIDEFRENNRNNTKEYKFVDPPVQYILPQIHAIHARQMNMVSKNRSIIKNRKFIPLNMKEVDSAMKFLNKENKRVANNCLERTMGVSIQN